MHSIKKKKNFKCLSYIGRNRCMKSLDVNYNERLTTLSTDGQKRKCACQMFQKKKTMHHILHIYYIIYIHFTYTISCD